jgi:hypothetical protein
MHPRDIEYVLVTNPGNFTTCYLLGQHPQVEAKLVEELNVILGDRVPIPEDTPRLRYTQMVLKESMRLYPAVWGIGRTAIADCEIGGYRVTAGTNIFIFQSLTQRDPRFFPNPDAFDPERWREDPIRTGGGPRVCVGAAFAMLEAGSHAPPGHDPTRVSSRPRPRLFRQTSALRDSTPQVWNRRNRPPAADLPHPHRGPCRRSVQLTGTYQLTELIRQCRFFRILRSDGANGRRQPWPGADSCHSWSVFLF